MGIPLDRRRIRLLRALPLFIALSVLPQGAGAFQEAIPEFHPDVHPEEGRGPEERDPETGKYLSKEELEHREAEKELRALEHELGPEYTWTYPGLDKKRLKNLMIVCPDTFYLLSQIQGIDKSKELEAILGSGNSPFLDSEDMSRRYEQVVRNYSIYGQPDWELLFRDSQLDRKLLVATQSLALADSTIPAALHPPLEGLKVKEFLTKWTMLQRFPTLASVIAELAPPLREPALTRAEVELEAAVRDAKASSSSAMTAVEQRATALTVELANLPQADEEKDWPNLIASVSNNLNGTVAALPKTRDPRRIRCVVAHGGRILDKKIEVPRWELLGVERKVVARDFRKLLPVQDAAEPVLFFGSNRDYSTHDLLPGRLTARSFDNSTRFADLHMANFHNLQERTLDPDKTVLFNLIPETDETIQRLGLKGSEERWRKARGAYDELAKRNKVTLGDGTSREKLLEVLRNGELDTIVIVAHGEADGIYLADGSKISVQDILDLEPVNSDRKPVVVLVSCQTGRFDASLRTMAQALLLRGRASAVLAPTEKVPALGPTLHFLERLLEQGAMPATKAFRNLAGPWQLYVEKNDAYWLQEPLRPLPS